MTILFSGGGTLGPVTPLLAIHEVMKKSWPGARFIWVGTARGPEKALIETISGISFRTLSSGKFRRYLSWWNLIDLFRIVIGFFQAVRLLLREEPKLCISAGGFISVPLHAAAWLLGIPTWVHQQDVTVGLANKLMAPFARTITTALKAHTASFSKKKVRWLGNPVREVMFRGTKSHALKQFGLDSTLPIVFATGGGTGSLRVNQMMVEAVQHLSGICQIIHLTGRERPQELSQNASRLFPYYHVFDFFGSEMADAYAAADLVISRGGFGTLTEIAALKKAAILIPKPGHQEENVDFLAKAGAVMLVHEKTSDGNYLAKTIKDALHDKTRRTQMAERLTTLLPVAKKEEILEIAEQLIHAE